MHPPPPPTAVDLAHPPRGDWRGFKAHFQRDLNAGFMVFLIALPLSLGIALASGFPAIAGIFSAILGAILCTFVSNSEMTIKGPAAGLIVIAIGCVESFGGNGANGGFTDIDMQAYRMALGVGVAAALLQIGFGWLRCGGIGEFFPRSVVHGMLSGIGLIIIAKQIPVALGVAATGNPLHLLFEIPSFVRNENPEIASIGAVSLILMFTWPRLRKRLGPLSVVPAPLIVLAVAIPMGLIYDLEHSHNYTLLSHTYHVGEEFLVSMPGRTLGLFAELTLPDFSGLWELQAWRWVLMFFLIGSLESVISAKAVDLLDPWKRKTDLSRDTTAIGVANLSCSFVGGLPVISEIVRSRANIDNGARTRFANLWHGVCLLLCVALIPSVVHHIPLAALAAMLVFTGFRLAHPSEFVQSWLRGKEQLLLFVVTLVGVLTIDLLVGVVMGVALEFLLHWLHGVPATALFRPRIELQGDATGALVVRPVGAAVFTGWIALKRRMEREGLAEGRHVILDLSATKLVDHTVMSNLFELRDEFRREGCKLELYGLEAHKPMSKHVAAARRIVRK